MSTKGLGTLGMYAVGAGAIGFVAENFIPSLKTGMAQTVVKWLIIGGVALFLIGKVF